MPLLERKVLAEGTASKENTIIARVLDGKALATIDPIEFIRLDFSPNVIRNSIQLDFVSDVRAVEQDLRSLSVTGEPPIRTYRGDIVLQVNNAFTHNFFIRSPTQEEADAGQLANGSTLAIPPGSRSLGQGFVVVPGSDGFSLFLSVLTPFAVSSPDFLGLRTSTWFAYNLQVIATGFEGTEFSQDSSADEELVSACVKDDNSIALYGERPGVSDIQSDFIETQTQAIRVGEAFLWNRNQVIEKRLTTIFNPSIKRGSTIQVTNANGNISFQGIVKSVGHTFDFGQGRAVTDIIVKSTEYVFDSFLGASQDGEKLDERQT